MKWLLATRRIFRVATPGSFAWNYTKTMAQTTILWGLFLFAIPAVLAGFEDDHWDLPTLGESRALAVAGFVVFGSLGLWAGVIIAKIGRGTPLPLDAAPVLAIAGPYRYVRNPMAISAPLQAISVSFWFDSTTVLLYGILAGFLWHIVIRPPEELDLEERFGDDYVRYRQNVRCWIPTFPGFDL